MPSSLVFTFSCKYTATSSFWNAGRWETVSTTATIVAFESLKSTF